ncbi:MAG: response regulator [Deltaproteobacteria bacterium]|nr:response regulator [Deltaproteobacteria bacterium]
MVKLWQKSQEMIGKGDKNPVQNPDTPILFVDDDPIIHGVIRKYLKDWNVTSVLSGEEALDLLENKNFVIVITDLRMPGIGGIELLHEIKAKYNNRVQVIVITVSDDLDDLVDALDGGASDFLLKPLKKEVLIEVLQHTVLRIERWNQSLNKLINKQSPP